MTLSGELLAVRSELEAAMTRIDRLILAADPTADEAHFDIVALPRTKAIEAVLANHDGPLRPVEIWAKLRETGRTDPKMEVQVTTFDLWQRGRIDKVARGLYLMKKA